MNQNNIKPQELRVNCLVMYKWFEKSSIDGKQKTTIHRETIKILGIDSANNRVLTKTNQTRKNHTWISIHKIRPIPLSEEVLLKCGFEKYQWQNAVYIKTIFGHLYLHFYKDRIITSFKSITYDYEGQKMKSLGFIGRKESVENIKYLHQLQNIFYSLTGEELEVRWT